VIEDLLKETEERMSKAVTALQNDLMTIRTGRASPSLVERLSVEYYGALTPLNQLATSIEKAILKSDLGLTPNNDGKIIRLVIPRLTEERRQELVKVVARRVEEGRVAIRNCRRDGINDLREFQKEKLISEDDFYKGRDEMQEVTDRLIKQVDEIGLNKEKEIMEV
jgi:ribosome recycling factor